MGARPLVMPKTGTFRKEDHAFCGILPMHAPNINRPPMSISGDAAIVENSSNMAATTFTHPLTISPLRRPVQNLALKSYFEIRNFTYFLRNHPRQ
jgi:hypothetical protein